MSNLKEIKKLEKRLLYIQENGESYEDEEAEIEEAIYELRSELDIEYNDSEMMDEATLSLDYEDDEY